MRRFSPVPLVWSGWVVARLILVRLILADEEPLGDVRYYHRALFGGDPTAMTEYPDAGVWPLRLLGRVTGPDLPDFLLGFVVMMALIDAAFLALLLLTRRPGRLAAAWFWVLFGVAAGPVLWLRLDLLPGVLVGVSAALLLVRPTWAAAVLAAATAVKLWPGVLAAGLVGGLRRTDTWLRLTVFAGTLAVLVAVTWATSGLARLLSPLTYQGDRGLQIESLAATPFLIHAQDRPGDYWTGYASSKSFEITGPGTGVGATLADAAMVAVLVFAVVWAVRSLLADRWRAETTLAFSVLLILLLVMTNKVFSPQYIVWLGPALAVALYATRSRLVQVMAALTVATAALGTWIYPFHYGPLRDDPATAVTEVTVLAARNGVMVALTLLAVVWLARETRRFRPVQ